MNLQIEKLIVWSKDGQKRNVVEFKLDCVNVLSGKSRTGKSAVSSIIDYCLGSQNCNIPIGCVRDNVSWFGIVVVLEDNRLLLARRNPFEQDCTDESVMKDLAPNEDVPQTITEHNCMRNDVCDRLAHAGGIDSITRNDFGGFTNERLSFRDTTHLLFQVQDIVANRYMLFYKMQKAEILERFKSWFDFIIGAETIRDVEYRKRLEEVRRELKQIAAEKDRIAKKTIAWKSRLYALLVEAKSCGFCCPDAPIPAERGNDTVLLSLAKEVIGKRKELLEGIRIDGGITNEIRDVRNKIAELSPQADQLEQEVSAFEDLDEAIEFQGSSVGVLKDRLSIAKWLKENAKPTCGVCPVCGEYGHTEASSELQKIINVVENCEVALVNRDKFSHASVKEMSQKKKELKQIKARLTEYNKDLAELLKVEKEQSNDCLVRSNRASAMITELKMIVELNKDEKHPPSDEHEMELRRQEKEYAAAFNEENIMMREKERIEKIGDLALKRLASLDCEDQYRQHPPIFAKDDMNINVQVQDGETVRKYALDQVGSASNWVALHIAVTCAFQEFFAAMKNPESCVPNFMVFDQPSQVYFPSDKLVRNDADEKSVLDNYKLKDADRVAVRKMFETLAKSILETKEEHGHTWQAIVLEHAGPDVYGNIKGVNVIDPPWRNGHALIPHDWYEGAQG